MKKISRLASTITSMIFGTFFTMTFFMGMGVLYVSANTPLSQTFYGIALFILASFLMSVSLMCWISILFWDYKQYKSRKK